MRGKAGQPFKSINGLLRCVRQARGPSAYRSRERLFLLRLSALSVKDVTDPLPSGEEKTTLMELCVSSVLCATPAEKSSRVVWSAGWPAIEV